MRQLEALLSKNGWTQKKRGATNHRIWKKGSETIVISGNPSSESNKGQEAEVLKRLGL
ncbi:type II toxin-antitoxin system HicA family toxin [Deinococcus lacus]|uniref:Type II toxin-antitoxin system HicA family toxin n=1 Tax=Deinococcus lacus TaxID=392561 RepID=A0ABW1YDP0_9DEIO